MANLRWVRSLLKKDEGSALVEGALILPVFLILVGGVYEFSFFLYQEQLVVAGIRDAARYLSAAADPNSVASQAVAKNLAVAGSVRGGPARVPGWTTGDVSISINSVENPVENYGSNPAPIAIITVETQFPAASLGFLGLLHLKRPTISATYQQRFVGGSAPS